MPAFKLGRALQICVMPTFYQAFSHLFRIISEAGQKICYYRSGLVSTDFPIPYMCQMGCCDRGCCTVADLAVNSSSISWTIALLTTVLVTALLASVAIFVVYLMNRRKDSILKKQIVYGGESPTASQVCGTSS
uniref:CX domain-containing protein n=1 Tax=Angiostrongylus cantonensis TaxID=6313 RepID=A0A0K0DKH6_ANGCA